MQILTYIDIQYLQFMFISAPPLVKTTHTHTHTHTRTHTHTHAHTHTHMHTPRIFQPVMLLCCFHNCLNSSVSVSQGYSCLLNLCLAKRLRCLCEQAAEEWTASTNGNVNIKSQAEMNKQLRLLHNTEILYW